MRIRSESATQPPQRVAVIGSGISGLSAAWLLSSSHRVTLFEKAPSLGGHSNTVDVATSVGSLAVDTGFIVFNKQCYPNLVALFEYLGVDYHSTTMSFGVSLDGGRLEYSGSDSIATLFGQRRNLIRPRFWRMVLDILRFYRGSEDWLETLPEQLSLGELLRREGFSRGFCDDHLLPMSAAIWSTPADKMLDYPAKTFLRFCINHGLVQLTERSQWQSVAGGSREYVRRIRDGLTDVRTNCQVGSVSRYGDHILLRTASGEERFDQVVFASHADQTLAMLADPSPDECRLLGAFGYENNRALLHSDEALMPKRQQLWSSWNYLSDSRACSAKVSVSYWMNALQNLPCAEPIIVTLNPLREPRPDRIRGHFSYQHPVFDAAALAAQRNLWRLQGQRRSWFCGSYFGYGFHEDGIQSGLAAAEALGGQRRPWQVENESGRIHLAETTVPAAAA